MGGVQRESDGRLEHVVVALALRVANFVKVIRVDKPPKVVLRVGSVQPQLHPRAHFSDNRGDAIRLRPRIESLQLGILLEVIRWWLDTLFEVGGGGLLAANLLDVGVPTEAGVFGLLLVRS